MKEEKIVSKADWILIIVLILLSIASIVFVFDRGRNSNGLYLSIQVDGREIDQLDFSKAMNGKSKTYHTDYGSNTVEFADDRAHISDADCPDKLCMGQGWISHEGQMLICLPHRFVVEVKSHKQGQQDSQSVDVMVQ